MPLTAVWRHRTGREEVLRAQADEATQGQGGLPELSEKVNQKGQESRMIEKTRTLANCVGCGKGGVRQARA
jgi:hypothetical protein